MRQSEARSSAPDGSYWLTFSQNGHLGAIVGCELVITLRLCRAASACTRSPGGTPSITAWSQFEVGGPSQVRQPCGAGLVYAPGR